MAQDREGRGIGRSGFGGTEDLSTRGTDDLSTRSTDDLSTRGDELGTRSAFGSTEDLSTRRTEDLGTRASFDSTEDLGTRSAFEDSARVGTRTGFGGAADDLGTRAGSFDRSYANEDLAADTVRGEDRPSRVSDALSSGKNRIADQLHRVGERIEDRARQLDESGGVQRRAGQVVHRASDALDTGANYLRDHEIDEMRDDLENAIRERPLLSVGLAVGAGFLLARILRD